MQSAAARLFVRCLAASFFATLSRPAGIADWKRQSRENKRAIVSIYVPAGENNKSWTPWMFPCSERPCPRAGPRSAVTRSSMTFVFEPSMRTRPSVDFRQSSVRGTFQTTQRPTAFGQGRSEQLHGHRRRSSSSHRHVRVLQLTSEYRRCVTRSRPRSVLP